MAKIIKRRVKSLYIWRNIQLTRSRVIIFISLLLLSFMLFIMNSYPYASVGLIMIPLSYILGIYSYKKYLLWLGGSIGEKRVLEALKKLSDDYAIISDIVVPPNRGDTDHIIMGKNGIFVVETKNHGGEISCIGDTWKRKKIGRRGGEYSLEIGSPSRQVKRNAKVLKDLILDKQYEIFPEGAPHIWIHSIIVFTNEQATLKLVRNTVPVVSVDKLASYISSKKPGKVFTDKNVEDISDMIIKYST